MKVLVGCEESQIVCKAFRAKGHEAYSCDLKPCSGGASGMALTAGCFAITQRKMGYDYCFSALH